MYHISRTVFWQNIKSPRWLSPATAQIWCPELLAFPKTKIIFEKEEISDHPWNSGKYDGQLMVTGRTVWVPEVPTLKGTEESLSYVQCFLYLMSSSIKVFIFHITWLDTFWTYLVYVGAPCLGAYILRSVIFLMFWNFYHYKMSAFASFYFFFILKSILSDISMATSSFFGCHLPRESFPTLSLWV